jgi:hypothetical protein
MAIIILIQAGHEFTYSGWSGGQIEIIGGASSGTVVQSNVKVCNSVVVHIMNAVLLPSSPLFTIPSQPSHNEPGKLISFIFFLPASAWHNLSWNPFLIQHVWVSRVEQFFWTCMGTLVLSAIFAKRANISCLYSHDHDSFSHLYISNPKNKEN